jgi:hypothetical protein
MTLDEMVDEVMRRLDEDPDSPVYWSLDDVRTAVTDGIAEMADACEWYEVREIVELDGSLHYDLVGTLGEPPLTVLAVRNMRTERWLRPTTVRELDRGASRAWQTVAGEPTVWFMRSPTVIGFFPVGESGRVMIHYSAMPPEAMEEMPVPEEFHRGAVYYALAELLSQDGERALALDAWNRYQRIERDLYRYSIGRTATDRTIGYAGNSE